MVGWSAHAGWEMEPVSLQAAATETGGREFRLIVSGTATAAIKMAAAAIETQRIEDRLDLARSLFGSGSTGEMANSSAFPSIDRILSSSSVAAGLSDRKKSELTDGRALRSAVNKWSSSRSSGIGNLRWRNVDVRVIS